MQYYNSLARNGTDYITLFFIKKKLKFRERDYFDFHLQNLGQ